MLKKVEDLTIPEQKGLNTVPNYFSLQKNQSPNMMDVKVNYDGSIEERLGSTTQNTVIIANSAAASFKTNSTGSLTNSLRSYWKLDEPSDERKDAVGMVTLFDSGGTLYSGGIQGQAALFNAGTGQSLYAVNPSTLTGNGNFTIAGWFYLNSTSTTAQRTIVSKSDFAPGTGQAGTNTLLLIHADGTNGSTSFPDASRYRRPITAIGSAAVSTLQSQFGGASARFNGSPDCLQIPYSTNFDFGAGDFTIDFWFRFNSISSFNGFYGDFNNGPVSIVYSTANSGTISCKINSFGGANLQTQATGLNLLTNSWIHLAALRSNGTVRIYTNGSQTAVDMTNNTNAIGSAGVLNYVGCDNAGDYLDGWIDEPRVSNIVRWNSDFTVASSPYANSPFGFEYWLYVDTNNLLKLDVSSSGTIANGTISASSIGALTTSTWYNYVGWLDSTNGLLGLSVNLQATSTPYTLGIISGSAPFVLGAVSNGASSFMDGRIDETGYWAKVLAKGEREDIYNAGNGNTFTYGFDTQPWAAFDFGASSLRWLTVAAGTGLYASSNLGVTFVNIATDRSATYQSFERSKNVLVATSDAYDTPLYWSGSAGTFASIFNPSAPLCKYSINFQGFLIFLNSNTRKRGFFYIDENTQLTGGTFQNFDIPSSADDEITTAFILRRYLYVSTRYKLYRISYVGGNPDWQYIEVKNWGFLPRTAKKIILTNNQPGVGFYYSIGEVAIGLTYDQKVRIFDGSGDQIISNPIEKDNKYCDFALEKISYVGSGPVISFAETDPNQNIYKLCVAIGQDSTQTTHFLNYDGRALAFYPYANMLFNCMCMAESANKRFLMAFDRSGKCHMMDSGNIDGNTTYISGFFDSPFLFEKSPSQSTKAHKTDLFLSNTSAGSLIYSDAIDASTNFKERRRFYISGSQKSLIHFEAIDIPETYNIYQWRLAGQPANTEPWRLLRYDHFVAGLGIGKNES